MTTDLQTDPHSRAPASSQSAPRRIAQQTADWTRTVVIIVGCLIAVVCAVAALYVAFQGMFFFIALVQRALSPGRFP